MRYSEWVLLQKRVDYCYKMYLHTLMSTQSSLLFLILAIQPVVEKPFLASQPDCYCTDQQGKRVELGETICLTVDGRSFQALCDMSLNNPIWRDTGDLCPMSHMSGPINTGAL